MGSLEDELDAVRCFPIHAIALCHALKAWRMRTWLAALCGLASDGVVCDVVMRAIPHFASSLKASGAVTRIPTSMLIAP